MVRARCGAAAMDCGQKGLRGFTASSRKLFADAVPDFRGGWCCGRLFILAVQIIVTLIEFKLTPLAGFILIPFALLCSQDRLPGREGCAGKIVASRWCQRHGDAPESSVSEPGCSSQFTRPMKAVSRRRAGALRCARPPRHAGPGTFGPGESPSGIVVRTVPQRGAARLSARN